MNKAVFIDVVVSAGYKGEPAVRINEEGTVASFRFGERIFDPKAENKTRWMNMTAKLFGKACQTVQKMELKGGSHVTMFGELSEDEWVDNATGETKKRSVFIANEIYFASSGKKSDADEEGGKTAKAPEKKGGTFTGYEAPAGLGSFYDED